MILMCPGLSAGRTSEEREDFLRKVAVLDVKTVAMSTRPDWTEEVADAGRFLDENGVRVGEFSSFYGGRHLGSADPARHQEAMEYFRLQLRHATALRAHCVGFS